MIYKSFLQQSVKANLNKKHFLKNLVNGMIFFLPANQLTNVVSQFGEAQTMFFEIGNAQMWDRDLTPQWRNARYPFFTTPFSILNFPISRTPAWKQVSVQLSIGGSKEARVAS